MVKENPKINYHLLYKIHLKNRVLLRKFLLNLFAAEGKTIDEVNYIFCSDEYLLNINREHLNHDYYTDIITFPLHEKQEDIRADIFISIERVEDNAATLGISFTDELHRVIIHGALHLCGYGDKTKSEIKKMRFKEDQYLHLLSFT